MFLANWKALVLSLILITFAGCSARGGCCGKGGDCGMHSGGAEKHSCSASCKSCGKHKCGHSCSGKSSATGEAGTGGTCPHSGAVK